MRLSSILKMRLRTLLMRSRVEQELDEELRYHLDRQIEENIALGMSPRKARFEALKEFVDFEQRKEECRDRRGFNLIDDIVQDLRYSLRQLAKSPGFTATAILLPALGLCAAVAIFAFVDAALLQPLPYASPSTLVGVYEHTPQCQKCNLSWLDYVDWKRMNNVFRSLDVYKQSGYIVTTANGAEIGTAAQVSAGFFGTLGVAPLFGRDFRENEDQKGNHRVVMLSYSAWRGRYGGDPSVAGRNITLDGEPYEIIGVLPKTFHFAPVDSPDYWAPINSGNRCEQRRSCHNLYGVARLKDGVTAAAALTGVQSIAQELEKQYPDSNKGQGAHILPLTEVIVGDIRPILLVLICGAALLHFIACVNVVSLLLVRSEGRRRELALRSALGASRLRLVRQFVTESVVLATAAAALGLAAAVGAMRLLTSLIPEDMLRGMPYLDGIGLNMRVLSFATGLVVMAAMAFAFTPALSLTFREMRQDLAEGGRGAAGTVWRRLGSKLVMVEVATAVVLLVGAGLLGQSLHRLFNVDLGFQPDGLATIQFAAPRAAYSENPKAVALARRVRSEVTGIPGVEAAATTSVLPVSFNGNTNWIRFVGKPYNGEHNDVLFRVVSADYLQTIGARLARGRFFTETDDESHPRVTIINEALARKYFPGEDPIGKQIGNTTLDPQSLRVVVGVVKDVREGPLDEDIRPAEYRPYNQAPDTYMAMVVRTSVEPDSALPALARTIRGTDPGIVTMSPISTSNRLKASPAAYMRRSAAWLVGGFAAVALLLGVVGIYGVIAYSVSQRTREIGVRMALGAERVAVYRLVLREAVWLVAIGITAGITGAVATTRFLDKLLFGIESWDVPTLGAVVIVLAVAALLASFMPARRAASVNPVDALRAE